MSNPNLGVIDCPTCGEPGAEVRQTKRRGARLYWQCGECGLNQPTGAKIQAKLWEKTDWMAGAEPIRPANVTSEAKRVTKPDFDPTEPEPEPEPPTERQPHKASASRGLGIMLLGALGLGVFLSTK